MNQVDPFRKDKSHILKVLSSSLYTMTHKMRPTSHGPSLAIVAGEVSLTPVAQRPILISQRNVAIGFCKVHTQSKESSRPLARCEQFSEISVTIRIQTD